MKFILEPSSLILVLKLYFPFISLLLFRMNISRRNRLKKTRGKTIRLTGGQQKTITQDGVTYQGADIFIINSWKGNDYVVLFELKDKTGKPYYQMPGGRCETAHKFVEDTIHDELWEESRKSIKISIPIFKEMSSLGKYVDYDGDSKAGLPGKRRCFVCKANKISQTTYDLNKKVLDKLTSLENDVDQGKPPGYYATQYKAFLETKSMKRIALTSLEESNREMIKQHGSDDGRSRMIDGVWVNKFVITAYIKSKGKNLIADPYRLSSKTHKEGPNENDYKIIGKCDYYE